MAVDHRHVLGAAIGLVAIRVTGARGRLAVANAVRRPPLLAAMPGDRRLCSGVAGALVAVRVADARLRQTGSHTRRWAITMAAFAAFAAFAAVAAVVALRAAVVGDHRLFFLAAGL
jgi:hypothetical protein